MSTLSQLFFLVATLLSLRIIYHVVYHFFISPLKRIPGPRLQAISSIPHDLACIKGTRHLHLEQLHDRYGPIVRISPNEVSFIDASIWRDVWSFRKNDEECSKADGLEKPSGYAGILDANRVDHRRFRRLLAHAFSEQSLRSQESRLHLHIDNLVNGLEAQEGNIDMTNWFQWTTFDIMGDLAFGESFKSLENQETHPWQQFLLDNIAASLFIGILQRMGLEGLIKFLTPNSLMKAVYEFYEQSSQRIDARIKYGKDRGDFMDYILKHGVISEDIGNEKGMRLGELKQTASDIAIAGSETTSTLLTGLLFLLLRNERVLLKLTDELRARFSREEEIDGTATDDMPYLRAVISEALRCFIPSPIPAGRTIPSGGLAVGGYFLPSGTRVFSAHHIAYRSSIHFARPKEFIPERWLPDRPEEFADDNADNIFQPFALGPRNCIGRNLANVEMRLILSRLLWRFDVRRPEFADAGRKAEWNNWMEGLKLFFLWQKPPMMVSMVARDK